MDAAPDTASGSFGAMGDEYDSLIHRTVPNYDEMIGLTRHRLAEPHPGFTGIACVWRDGMWAVVTADRPSSG